MNDRINVDIESQGVVFERCVDNGIDVSTQEIELYPHTKA